MRQPDKKFAQRLMLVGFLFVVFNYQTLAAEITDTSQISASSFNEQDNNYKKNIINSDNTISTPQIEQANAGVDVNKQEPSASLEKPKKIPSLLFTYWQYQSILDAVASRVDGKMSGDFLDDDEKKVDGEPIPEKPEDREISLGGIVFVNDGDWTVWLNGMRITPDAVPTEVIDIKVTKNYLDVKWYDKYTNKIFPIRIRPHQRFNLDTRVFLPG